jgi:hypothetical protein
MTDHEFSHINGPCILEALKLEQQNRQNNAASECDLKRGITEERTDDDRNLT